MTSQGSNLELMENTMIKLAARLGLLLLALFVLAGCAGKKLNQPDAQPSGGDGPGVESPSGDGGTLIDDSIKADRFGENELGSEDNTAGNPGADDGAQGAGEWGDSGGPLATIYFDYDSAGLTDSALETIQQNGLWLKRNPTSRVLLEGHTDERGTEEYNIELSARRAKSVKSQLVLLGIVDDRIETLPYGEEKPAREGQDESAWRLNRRVEFRVSGR